MTKASGYLKSEVQTYYQGHPAYKAGKCQQAGGSVKAVDSQMSSSAFNASHREFYPFLHVMSIRELTQEAPTQCSLNVTLGNTYTSIYNRLCPFPMTGPIIAVVQYQATGINGAGEGTTHKVGTACTLKGQTRP